MFRLHSLKSPVNAGTLISDKTRASDEGFCCLLALVLSLCVSSTSLWNNGGVLSFKSEAGRNTVHSPQSLAHNSSNSQRYDQNMVQKLSFFGPLLDVPLKSL